MAIFRTCLCWRDVRTGSAAAGVLTMTLSFLQILVQIAIWTANEYVGVGLDHNPYIVYIPLAALDFFVVIFSLVLMVGIERDLKGRHMLLPWIILVSIYLCYETPVNIYFFVQTFPLADSLNQGITYTDSVVTAWPQEANILVMLIVLVVYWLMKTLLYVLGVLCVISRYQELRYYRRRYGRHTLDESFDVPIPRPREYIRYLDPHPRDYAPRGRDFVVRDREPYYGAPAINAPPRYPQDREERARTDYKTPRHTTSYLEPKRYEPYPSMTPYVGGAYPPTPRIYPNTDHAK